MLRGMRWRWGGEVGGRAARETNTNGREAYYIDPHFLSFPVPSVRLSLFHFISFSTLYFIYAANDLSCEFSVRVRVC